MSCTFCPLPLTLGMLRHVLGRSKMALAAWGAARRSRQLFSAALALATIR